MRCRARRPRRHRTGSWAAGPGRRLGEAVGKIDHVLDRQPAGLLRLLPTPATVPAELALGEPMRQHLDRRLVEDPGFLALAAARAGLAVDGRHEHRVLAGPPIVRGLERDRPIDQRADPVAYVAAQALSVEAGLVVDRNREPHPGTPMRWSPVSSAPVWQPFTHGMSGHISHGTSRAQPGCAGRGAVGEVGEPQRAVGAVAHAEPTAHAGAEERILGQRPGRAERGRRKRPRLTPTSMLQPKPQNRQGAFVPPIVGNAFRCLGARARDARARRRGGREHGRTLDELATGPRRRIPPRARHGGSRGGRRPRPRDRPRDTRRTVRRSRNAAIAQSGGAGRRPFESCSRTSEDRSRVNVVVPRRLRRVLGRRRVRRTRSESSDVYSMFVFEIFRKRGSELVGTDDDAALGGLE